MLQRWVTAQDILVTTESADAPALLSRDQKPPCDQPLWTMNTFLPFLAPGSFVPTSHPEHDFTGNTSPSDKSTMNFYFSLYNKEALQDELNLISGQSNPDATENKGNQCLT